MRRSSVLKHKSLLVTVAYKRSFLLIFKYCCYILGIVLIIALLVIASIESSIPSSYFYLLSSYLKIFMIIAKILCLHLWKKNFSLSFEYFPNLNYFSNFKWLPNLCLNFYLMIFHFLKSLSLLSHFSVIIYFFLDSRLKIVKFFWNFPMFLRMLISYFSKTHPF